MTFFRCSRLAGAGAALITVIALMAGCANGPQSGAQASGGTSSMGASSAGKLPRVFASSSDDIVTASDESEPRKRARIRLELATAYFAQGQLATALDELKHVLAIDERLSDAHELRGLIYGAMEEPGLAEESFRRAIQLNERNGSALHNYAWWLCNNQRYPEADALFERAASLTQTVVVSKTLMAQGVCQFRAGRLADAEKTLSRSYELDVGNPATAYNLANVLYRRGDLERARFYIRRVNSVPEQVTAESLWLGIRIENKLGNPAGRDDLASVMRSRFPGSREASALELGRFNE